MIFNFLCSCIFGIDNEDSEVLTFKTPMLTMDVMEDICFELLL